MTDTTVYQTFTLKNNYKDVETLAFGVVLQLKEFTIYIVGIVYIQMLYWGTELFKSLSVMDVITCWLAALACLICSSKFAISKWHFQYILLIIQLSIKGLNKLLT